MKQINKNSNIGRSFQLRTKHQPRMVCVRMPTHPKNTKSTQQFVPFCLWVSTCETRAHAHALCHPINSCFSSIFLCRLLVSRRQCRFKCVWVLFFFSYPPSESAAKKKHTNRRTTTNRKIHKKSKTMWFVRTEFFTEQSTIFDSFAKTLVAEHCWWSSDAILVGCKSKYDKIEINKKFTGRKYKTRFSSIDRCAFSKF